MKLLLMCLLALAPISFVNGADGVNYGVMNYQDQTLDSINVDGIVNIKNSTFTGTVEIKGGLNATDATIANLRVQGGANLSNCKIKQAYIDGILRADKTTFQELSIATERFTLNECKADSIVVRKALGLGKQIVLLNNTTISGNITFDTPSPGEVWLDSGSSVQGQIIGGSAIKK